MPKWRARLATIAPIAPSPITPRVFPISSGPTNWLLPFSARAGISSPFPAKPFAHLLASITGRLESKSARRTSSFTAFALAPGVLNTTTPFSVSSGIGILLVPAPARATAFTLSESCMSCISAERTRIASGLLISDAIS